MRSQSLHRAARAIVPQSLHGLGKAIVIHEIFDCLAKPARLVFEVSESDVAVAAKYSAYLICFVIVIHYESRCTLFNVDATNSARMVLLFEYRLAILICLVSNPAIATPARLTKLTHSICSSSIFAEKAQWFCLFASGTRSFSRCLHRGRHRNPIRRARVCPFLAAINMIEALR